MVLKLYGVKASQPVRAVQWLLEMKGLPYEFVKTDPGSPKGSRAAEFLAKNPIGTVPLIDDDGFLVWESNAILAYLCDKNGWTDLYPKDVKVRAICDQWMHFHHQNTRKFTLAVFAPVFRPDLKIPEAQIKADMKLMRKVAQILDAEFGKTKFISGDSCTIADICIYEELGQLQAKYCDGFDFGPYKNIQGWFQSMEQLPAYEKTHGFLVKLGKIFKAQKAKAAKL